MATYIVKSTLKHDGKEYLPGSEVDLPTEIASARPWCVEEKKKPAAPPAKPETKTETPPK